MQGTLVKKMQEKTSLEKLLKTAKILFGGLKFPIHFFMTSMDRQFPFNVVCFLWVDPSVKITNRKSPKVLISLLNVEIFGLFICLLYLHWFSELKSVVVNYKLPNPERLFLCRSLYNHIPLKRQIFYIGKTSQATTQRHQIISWKTQAV